MIHEIDESIRALVRRDAGFGDEVDVVFDAPTKDWSSQRNAPTVDVYLYDVREDPRRRHTGRIDVREDGQVVERLEPPRWFKLSYLVTAWTQRPVDEHRVLSMLLGCFLRHDRLPRELLIGSLGDVTAAISYTCALPPPQDRALSDVWSALGGELKPSLDLVVVAPFQLGRAVEMGPPVEAGVQLALAAGAASDRRTGPRPMRQGTTAPDAPDEPADLPPAMHRAVDDGALRVGPSRRSRRP